MSQIDFLNAILEYLTADRKVVLKVLYSAEGHYMNSTQAGALLKCLKIVKAKSSKDWKPLIHYLKKCIADDVPVFTLKLEDYLPTNKVEQRVEHSLENPEKFLSQDEQLILAELVKSLDISTGQHLLKNQEADLAKTDPIDKEEVLKALNTSDSLDNVVRTIKEMFVWSNNEMAAMLRMGNVKEKGNTKEKKKEPIIEVEPLIVKKKVYEVGSDMFRKGVVKEKENTKEKTKEPVIEPLIVKKKVYEVGSDMFRMGVVKEKGNTKEKTKEPVIEPLIVKKKAYLVGK